jgi:hypothetical protein
MNAKQPLKISKLKKKLDSVFSKWIRARDKKCYTCGRTENLQCGHFIPRQYLAVRFDERNCHAQCYACNMLYNGQPSAYALNLQKQYGKKIIQELENQRKVITKLTPDWYLEKLKYYAN